MNTPDLEHTDEVATEQWVKHSCLISAGSRSNKKSCCTNGTRVKKLATTSAGTLPPLTGGFATGTPWIRKIIIPAAETI